MIRVDTRRLDQDMAAGLAGLKGLINDKAFANSAATCLAAGASVIAKRAKQLAPKRGRSKKGQAKTYGKTGLLKKAIKVKKGVGKKGAPFAVVGPDAKVSESVRRGKKTITQKPSNYSHLVEDGFRAHHRVPLVTGRTGEAVVKKGVTWKGSDLEKYMRDQKISMTALSKGKLHRAKKFIGGGGQGTSQVPGQKYMAKAYATSSGSIGPAIVTKLESETTKAITRLAARTAQPSGGTP